MGSDLYVSVEVKNKVGHWFPIFEGPSRDLARGIVVDAFGDCDPTSPLGEADGYLSHDEWCKMAEHPECPWRLDEPYWVRCISGEEFCDIIHEKRWQKLQDGDFHDLECSFELRAVRAMVGSLLMDMASVRVWCWHSQ